MPITENATHCRGCGVKGSAAIDVPAATVPAVMTAPMYGSSQRGGGADVTGAFRGPGVEDEVRASLTLRGTADTDSRLHQRKDCADVHPPEQSTSNINWKNEFEPTRAGR
jgi:hypothetical protein